MDLPNHVLHLKPMVSNFCIFFDNDETLTHEKLGLMVSIFIRFFDTLPIYNGLEDSDETKWTMILKAKKMAGLFLHNDLIHGVRSSIAIIRWRKEIMKSNKEILICT